MALLDEYYRGLTPKSRLIVALASHEQMTFDVIRTLTVQELRDFLKSENQFGSELLRHTEEFMAGKDDQTKAITNPSGRPYSVTDIDRILKRAHERANYKYTGRLDFVKTMDKHKKKAR